MANVGAIVFGTLAAAGVSYTLFAAFVTARFGWGGAAKGAAEPVTLLKPLYGAEPRLAENLASFLDQDWDAPIEMIAGVQRADDPARAAVTQLRHASAGWHRSREGGALAAGNPSLRWGDGMDRGDGRDVTEVLDPTPHGANAKVSNLITMAPAATHDLLVLSDSDMAVPREYLATLAGALAMPGVGAVTCLYRGRGDAGPWSRLAAAQVSYQFLPSALVGLRLGLAHPCMGSTIALRRATLEAIGGLPAFADVLADDYAIGAAVRGLGLEVAVPPMILVHGCAERSFGAVWRHELRWQATVRGVDPVGAAGSIVTYPVPLALIAACFSFKTGALLLVASIMARFLLKQQIDRASHFYPGEGKGGVGTGMTAWLLPFRDCLSFATYVAAFFVRSVDWRGARLTMQSKGRIAADPPKGPPGQVE